MEKRIKCLIVISILAFTIPFILNYNSQTEKRIIKISFIVGNTSGFDLNPKELTFGQITPNNSASRAITITNNLRQRAKVNIRASGEIKEYIIASENNFFLDSNESKDVTFSVYATNTTEFKKYSGEIIIILK